MVADLFKNPHAETLDNIKFNVIINNEKDFLIVFERIKIGERKLSKRKSARFDKLDNIKKFFSTCDKVGYYFESGEYNTDHNCYSPLKNKTESH